MPYPLPPIKSAAIFSGTISVLILPLERFTLSILPVFNAIFSSRYQRQYYTTLNTAEISIFCPDCPSSPQHDIGNENFIAFPYSPGQRLRVSVFSVNKNIHAVRQLPAFVKET